MVSTIHFDVPKSTQMVSAPSHVLDTGWSAPSELNSGSTTAQKAQTDSALKSNTSSV